MSQRSDFGSSRSDAKRMGDVQTDHPFMRRIHPTRAHADGVPGVPGALVHPDASKINYARRSSKGSHGSAGSARDGSARGLSWEDKASDSRYTDARRTAATQRVHACVHAVGSHLLR